MLSGGHPNSLGRTEEAVELVLEEEAAMDDLLDCYRSDDAVVRLRVSSALKRVTKARPQWTLARTERLLGEVAALDQPSARWTLAQLFDLVWDGLDDAARRGAVDFMRRNLRQETDWIVLATTMKVLARRDPEPATLAPLVAPHRADPRRSVAGAARKALEAIA